jgi:NADP-dependent 3-hydroxy acid dehydrogenase YdfG
MTTNKENHGIVLITGARQASGANWRRSAAHHAEALVLLTRRPDRLEKLREELRARSLNPDP